MKKMIKKFTELPVNKKIQLIIALTLSIALIIVIPVGAWFGNQRRIIKLQKIQSPNMLILSAAHREDKMFFEIDGINADENMLVYDGVDASGNPKTRPVLKAGSMDEYQKITHKDYVFCVTGDAVDEFTIQLAHTTNNPFTYSIYAANEYETFAELLEDSSDAPEEGSEINYLTYTMSGKPAAETWPSIEGATDYSKDKVLFYTIDSECSRTTKGQYMGSYLNEAKDSKNNGIGKALTNDTYFTETYNTYGFYQQDAVPLYWQETGVQAFPGQSNPNKKAFSRNFILRVSWAEGTLNNNSKETDIIYLTVKATS